jgi:hypothetical protein
MSSWSARRIALLSGASAPSLDLNFLSGGLDPRITFTRAAGPATYFDSAGTLQTAGTNVARFDTDPATLAPRGLLIEEARANLALQSADASHAAWAKTGNTVAAPTVTANQAIAPDGSTTAAKVVYPALSGGGWTYLNQAVTATAAAYTQSVWLKGNSGGEQLYLFTTPDAVTYYRQTVTLTTGWQRFSLTTPNLTAVSWFWCIGADHRDAGQSNTAAQTIFVWGGQIELGAFATSYIPTTAATATRAADVATMPTAGWFNPAAISVVADVMPLAPSGAPTWISFDDGTNANRDVLYTSSLAVHQFQALGGATSFDATSGTLTQNAVNRMGAVWSAGRQLVAVNGSAPVVTAFASLPTVTTLRIGSNPSLAQANGAFRRVRYWPRQLSAAELQNATR